MALLHPPQEFKWAPLRDLLLEDDILPSDVFRARAEAGAIPEPAAALDKAVIRIEMWESAGHRFLTYLDTEYPRQLKEVHDLPPFVFARGILREAGVNERAVSIVGSRDASSDALRDASKLAAMLVQANIPVVSGLAAGIDAAAHTAALRSHGRTVAVIGTGIDKYYPKSSEPIQREIEASQGLVLSQFWPGTAPTRYNFPMRNGVMSAFSCATVIVEASEKSGTKHQAFKAIAHGRPLILSGGVARNTTWGRKLASDPLHLDVTVVNSVEEAFDAAKQKAEPPRAVFASSPVGAGSW